MAQLLHSGGSRRETILAQEEYDTFGGLVFGALGAIPADGAQPELDVCGVHVKVQSILEHRLQSALVITPEPAEAEA